MSHKLVTKSNYNGAPLTAAGKPMRTYFGIRVGFELRKFETKRAGKKRSHWYMVREFGSRRASPEEVRLWRSLPGHMRFIRPVWPAGTPAAKD